MSLFTESELKRSQNTSRDEETFTDVGKTVFELLAEDGHLEGSDEFSKDFVMSVTRKGNYTVPDESTPPPSRPFQKPSTPPARPNKIK